MSTLSVKLSKRVGTGKFHRTGVCNNGLAIETATQTINQTLARHNFIFCLQMLLATLKQYPYYTRLNYNISHRKARKNSMKIIPPPWKQFIFSL